ncbi:GM17508 [Drosophila sechellia]|uniref:GM17508 n=1 Tax=Drosophila sechellia TaxID=7238 RepID=B4HYY4_DROSE|nr:GM17508 [Drosophila sechellia]
MEKRATSTMQVLYAELAAAKSRSAELEEENILLRHRLNRASASHSTNAAINVEAKIMAFQLEEERDRLVETLQKHKKKYNKLHDAYLEKVKRCRALEEMFKRQKTLTGLVMKSSLDQRNAEQRMALEKRQSAQSDVNELNELKAKVEKLQRALDESYDIIDEMDFELESVELLEMQNQTLRDELAAFKANSEAGATSLPASLPNDDDPPPKYEEDYPGQHHKAMQARRCSSSSESDPKDDDADAETIERAALTHSVSLNNNSH